MEEPLLFWENDNNAPPKTCSLQRQLFLRLAAEKNSRNVAYIKHIAASYPIDHLDIIGFDRNLYCETMNICPQPRKGRGGVNKEHP